MIPESFIEELRARLDIAEVIGREVALRKSGTSLLGKCPFHDEATPSFRVYPEQRRFRCYGCGVHGDAFEFARRLQGKDFPEVIRMFAAEVGVPVPTPTESPQLEQHRRERAAALGACEVVTGHWQALIASATGDRARTYLRGLGVGEDVAGRFRLGVASASWRDISFELARTKGLAVDDLERAGLTVRARGVRLDRFRGRLMFPCTDPEGRVIGFAGGAMDEGAAPPFLVSRPSVLMRGDREFFGMYQATAAVRSSGAVILVPSCEEVLRLHAAGHENVLAPVGDHFSAEHLAALNRRGARSLVMLGYVEGLTRKALARQAAVVLVSSIPAAVAQLEMPGANGEPRFGKSEVDAALRATQPFSEYLITHALERAGPAAGSSGALERRLAAANELATYAAKLPPGLVRSTFERRIAQRLQLKLEALRAAIPS